MNYLKKILSFLTSNFGPLIGFYVANLFWGFKVAVIISIGVAFLEYAWLKFNKRTIDSFFYFSSGIAIVFGLLDLSLQAPFFFKLEAAITNLLFSIVFALSLFKEKPIVQIFAENSSKESFDKTEDIRFFFVCFTLFWAFYFFVKAVIFLWINFNAEFENALILRVIIGKISLMAMVAISTLLPRQIWTLMFKAQVFPSQKTKL